MLSAAAERAVERGAETLLIPVSSHKQLNDLSDDMATTITGLYHSDAQDHC